MARSINQISTEIINNIKADPVLKNQLTSTSSKSIFKLLADSVATEINLFEQYLETFTTTNLDYLNKSITGTIFYIYNKVLLFQYNDQIVIDKTTYQFSYPVVNTSKRIITLCTLQRDFNSTLIINIAKTNGNSYTQLNSDELTQATTYINQIIPISVTQPLIQSSLSDKIYIKGTIKYNGTLYTLDQIQTAVINNINTYINGIPQKFIPSNGILNLYSLLDSIRTTDGVIDIIPVEIGCRKDSTSFTDRTILISNSTINQTSYTFYSGYGETETTTGYTIQDSLTFTPNI